MTFNGYFLLLQGRIAKYRRCFQKINHRNLSALHTAKKLSKSINILYIISESCMIISLSKLKLM